MSYVQVYQVIKFYSLLFFLDVLFPINAREIELYLEPVCDQWRNLGRELGLPERVLKQFDRSRLPQALRGLVKVWLEYFNAQTCCWATLVKALNTLRLNHVVARISLNRGMCICMTAYVHVCILNVYVVL